MSAENSYKAGRRSSEVMVGRIGIGGSNPVRIQSMTNTPTLDTGATVEQIIRIASAGADIVRMTVQSRKEAMNLENIKRELHRRECFIPLVADVHFNPAIAEIAAAIVDKVRINPGNYGIGPAGTATSFSAKAYDEELSGAGRAFFRLLDICSKSGTALRIGVNHGSLSSRIIYRHGNTPEGMVHSAMEFLHFCREYGFHNVVVSLKSSNILVMIRANRLMAVKMREEGMAYPLHLGVTEAGEGEDGRIRSAAGIGTLLAEGIGDTIRVSLTEDPEKEIPVARKLMMCVGELQGHMQRAPWPEEPSASQPYRRVSLPVVNIGGDNVPVVIFAEKSWQDHEMDGGRLYAVSSPAGPVINATEAGGNHLIARADYLFGPSGIAGQDRHPGLYPGDPPADMTTLHFPGFPVIDPPGYLAGPEQGPRIIFVRVTLAGISPEFLEKAAPDERIVFIAEPVTPDPVNEIRAVAAALEQTGCRQPLVAKMDYDTADTEHFQVRAAVDLSPLIIDRVIDGVWIGNKKAPDELVLSAAFSILQSCRARTTRTEFISCPSCGRTMFDIQKATAEVKRRTSHLRGLKIAVMGCIVNGPGEMADADYGYVGSGRGRVSLYRKQQKVKSNVPEERAVEELIELIKEWGHWREP